jgi:hypothetical protein
MGRPTITPWHRFARGYQATIRQPYHDLEVFPHFDQWRWRVLAMDSSSGQFREVSSGMADTLTEAQSAAISAVPR